MQTENVNVNGLLLKKLKPNTKYWIEILSSSQQAILCNASFRTQGENYRHLTTTINFKQNAQMKISFFVPIVKSSQNAVEGVRAHVYYPFINNKTVITATVVWRNLSNEVSITHYRLRVITLYDMAMNGNKVSA